MEPANDSLRVLVTTLPRRAAALAIARRLVVGELAVCAQAGVALGARRALVGEEPR
jgi:hypothetical protein